MILVDSNVILDILTIDPKWYQWSANKLSYLSESHNLIINDIIYTEISIGFDKIEDLDDVISESFFKILPIPKSALFLAGKAFLNYKRKNGSKNLVLPDFFIGAHAAILKIPLLTRDISRYKTYFPTIELISP
jgi:predicted nucleic acid-binding protein